MSTTNPSHGSGINYGLITVTWPPLVLLHTGSHSGVLPTDVWCHLLVHESIAIPYQMMICQRASLGVHHILAVGPFPYATRLWIPPLAISPYTRTSREVCVRAQLTGHLLSADCVPLNMHRTGCLLHNRSRNDHGYVCRVPSTVPLGTRSSYMAAGHVQKDL